MNIKTLILGFLVLVAGSLAYLRPHGQYPADLRDAVADNREFDISMPVFEKGGDNMPEPEMQKVTMQKKTAIPGNPEGFFKNLDGREGVGNKGYAGISTPYTEPDKLVASTLSSLPGETPYEKVKNLFENSVPAAKEDLTGWHSGRAFRKNGSVEGALIIVQSGNSNMGPLFGEQTVAILLAHPKPAHYDNQSYEEKKNMVEGLDQELGVEYWAIAFPEAVGTPMQYGKRIVEWRKIGIYIVERMSGGELPDLYSYYFRAIAPVMYSKPPPKK